MVSEKALGVAKEKQSDGRFYGPVLPGKIARLAALLAICLITLSTGALTAIGFVASREADRQMTAAQTVLLRNALQDEFTRMARDQLSVAHWHDVVETTTAESELDFLRVHLAKALINDYGHDQIFLIGPDRYPLMVASSATTTLSAKKSDISEDVIALAAETVEGLRAAGSSGQQSIDRTQQVGNASLDSAHYAFGMVDNQVALLSALPVDPADQNLKSPDKEPVILVSARVLSEELLSSISRALHFDALTLGPLANNQQKLGSIVLSSSFGERLATLEWQSPHPGPEVWNVIVPLILALALIFSTAAVTIAIKIGRVSEKLELSEQANKLLAMSDSLTGLSNRLHFNMLIDESLTKNTEQPFALLVCDLDRFKAVNDTFGHAAGDMVLQAVAERLKLVVGKSGTVSRIGGDEFILLIDAYHDVPQLSVLAQSIINAVSGPVKLPDGAKTDVGISIGIVISNRVDDCKVALMHNADEALYEAKTNGRGQFVFAKQCETGGQEQPVSDAATKAA